MSAHADDRAISPESPNLPAMMTSRRLVQQPSADGDQLPSRYSGIPLTTFQRDLRHGNRFSIYRHERILGVKFKRLYSSVDRKLQVVSPDLSNRDQKIP
jgi:hypothetical protein